jgi:hypothetical protein
MTEEYELDPPEHVHYSVVCFRCANLTDGVDHRCRAFPDGIPWPIWDGENDHKAPYEGDHGIQFVPHGREKKGQ